MSLGMTYEEYWYGKADMVQAYYRAYTFTRKRRNEEMWVQGIYVCRAVAVAINNNFKGREKYFTEPLDIYPKTIEEKEIEKEKERKKVMEFFNNLKRKWDSKNGNNRQPNT